MSINKFEIILESSVAIAPNVQHFRFYRQDRQPFSFIAGQFVTLLIESEDKILRRSYSLANVPQAENQYIEFAASFVPQGRASSILFNLQPGESLLASGPFGRLILPESLPKRLILQATGTGITPYRAMLGSLEAYLQNAELQVVILQGARHLNEVLYTKEFQALAAQFPQQVYYRACLSRETLDEAFVYQGYVQDILTTLNLDAEQDMLFLCGNPNMIDATVTLLEQYQFPTKQIKREKYISSN